MTDELVLLRVLLVSPSAQEREWLREGAAMAPIPLEVLEADGATTASVLLARGGFDLALLDGALPRPELAAIAAAADACASAPFVVVLAPDHEAAAAMAADVIGDGVAVKPASEYEAAVFIERSIRVRLPSRVLVVDDSATTRRIVRKILAASRFRTKVAEASEGLGALQQIGYSRFDLVILDYNMPGLNGVETLSEIKRVSPEINVALMTSAPDQRITERARELGAVACLRKPFYASDIDAVMCSVFGMRAPGRG
jgi:DNA-binding response OmpR family regulator